MNLKDKVLVLGGKGMVGSAIVRALKARGYAEVLSPSHSELNLLDQNATLDYFKKNLPKHVFLSAARVGGIVANNTFRADFLYENLEIQNNTFGSAYKTEVEKLLFLGSSCIYPKNAPQPIKESYLLSGELEFTNEPYAIAKIAGLKLAENYRRQYGKKYFAVMPTNLYGENDNYDPQYSHVIPGLLSRMHQAKLKNDKIFPVWGTGNPKREFLYVDDMADACLFLMENADRMEMPYWMNVGFGEDIAIKDLAEIIKETIGFQGQIQFDTNIPDGTHRKLLDSSSLRSLGWKPKVHLREGLKMAYAQYLKKLAQ